jgi:hypothetical protein
MQPRPAHQLDVEVALADRADGCLPHDGERVDEKVIELGPVVEPLAELGRLRPQSLVVELFHLGLEGVDVGDDSLEGLELLAFAGTEDAVEDAHAGFKPIAWPERHSGGYWPDPGPAPNTSEQKRRVFAGWRPAQVSPYVSYAEPRGASA